MLFLYQSNRLEQLGQLLTGMVRTLPLSDPFAPETIILHSMQRTRSPPESTPAWRRRLRRFFQHRG